MVSMFYTSKMSDQEFLDFVRLHTVSGSCGTHGAEKAAAAQQDSFTKSMLSQASTVFGADNGVFNTMKNAYSALLAAGPSQQGFSAAQQSAMNASAITNGANQTRFATASLGRQQAGAGGGNAPNTSGIGAGARAQVAEAGAASTASELNKIQQENYAQGNINWRTAGEELGKAPGVFNNLEGVDRSAQTGLDKNMSNAQAADAASNWWVKPVTGLVAGGLNMIAPGVGTAMATGGAGSKSSGGGGGMFSNGMANTSSDSSFSENIGNFFNGMGGGTTG
jgi:hypothetical protein